MTRFRLYDEVQAVIQDEMPLIPINYVTIFALDNNVVPIETAFNANFIRGIENE